MDFAIALDNHSVPLHRQLYENLRQSILAGRLVPGQRIPSTRALARLLSVSRSTVTQSYEQLLSEGYLQAVTGSGTFVCHQLPDDLLRSAPVQSAMPGTQATHHPMQLSTYGVSLTDTEPFQSPGLESPISFRYGHPALDEIPLSQWRQLLSRHCRLGHRAMLDYTTDPLGYRPLRETITQYLARSRAVQCEANQVIIVSGSQQALDLVTRILIDRGELVALENPGYLGARRTFMAQGANLWPIPVDESGLVIEHLKKHSAEKIKLVYVTPSHQFPTGVVLSLPRRLELLAWAQQAGAIIVEDDYDSEYRYEGRPIPALQGLDQSNSVIYIGTFSKVLFPALRVGYLVVPQALVHVFARAKWLTDRQSPLLEQYVLTDFINKGYLERHIRRMRTLYDQRRQALVQALALHLKEQVTILGENAGIHLMVRLHTRFSDEEVISRAAQAGVGLFSARPYYLGIGCTGEFVLGYADLSEPEIQEGVCRLAQVLME